MADPQNFLDLSDEEFLKQGASLLDAANASATSAADAAGGSAGDQGAQDGQGTDDAEQQRLADEEAARVAAEQGQNGDEDQSGQGGEQGAAATAAGTGDATADQSVNKEGDVDDDAVGDDAGAADANAGKKRGPDGKFVKDDAAANTGADDKGKQDPAKDGKDQQQVNQPVDYKAEHDKLLAPFKANGRDIRVENVDEAIRLMQMGANYNRKMAALKPNLAILKMLENNNLLSPEKIGFLIDLDKKNPEAISKLVKDSGVDPLDISVEKAGDYKPGNHGVNEAEVELDTVLDELKDSPKLTETLDLVGRQWDVKSRQLIAAQPQLLKVLNGHMESGVFDLVATELERKKLFGGLHGLSDLEAYRQVGDEMASSGKFDHMQKRAGQPAPAGQQTPVVKTVVTPAPKKADDSKREEQRRAAAPAKVAAPAGKLPADFNPLALSDEEFAKFKPTF